MKAWLCTTDNSDGTCIVYANTRSEARVSAMRTDTLESPRSE